MIESPHAAPPSPDEGPEIVPTAAEGTRALAEVIVPEVLSGEIPPDAIVPRSDMADVEEARADRGVQTVCLLILAIIAVGVAMSLLRPVLVPFVLAVFLSYCLSPVIEGLQKYFRLPRIWAVIGAVIVGLGVLALVGGLVALSLNNQSDTFAKYKLQFDQVNQKVTNWPPLARFGIHGFNLPEEATVSFVTTAVAEVTQIASSGALVVIFMIFILLGSGRPRRPETLLAQIEENVRRYINATVFLSLLTGALVAAILSILRVEFAGVFGLLAFLLNFIPNVGSIVATLLPLPVVIFAPHLSPTAKVLAIAIPTGVQLVIGTLQPRVQGGAVDLHPVAVLLALIFFGMIWGLPGAFLATPITAVIKIILERIPQTRPLARLLAGDLEHLTAARDLTGRPPERRA